jgi:hypothetical protein
VWWLYLVHDRGGSYPLLARARQAEGLSLDGSVELHFLAVCEELGPALAAVDSLADRLRGQGRRRRAGH